MNEIELQLGEVPDLKTLLDSDFVKDFVGIAERFFQNYTGKNIQGYFSGSSDKDTHKNTPAVEPYAVLDAKLRLSPHMSDPKSRVHGTLVLEEGALNTDSERFFSGRVDKYQMYFSGDTCEFSFPNQEQNILPTRMMDRHIGVFSALDNAIKGVITEKPTRYIPTNKDTLIHFEDERAVQDKVSGKLKEKGYKTDWVHIVYIGNKEAIRLSDIKEDWMPEMYLNPMNGRISGYNRMSGHSFYPLRVAGIALKNLRGALETLEKEVVAAILDYNPTTLTDIMNKTEAQKILAQ